MKRLALTSLAVLVLAGCRSIPERPADFSPATDTAVVPAEWSSRLRAEAARLERAPSDTLWGGFGDPDLSALVLEALESNPDVREAAARIREARASVRLARAALRPTVGTSAGYSRSRSSRESVQGFAIPDEVTPEFDEWDIGGTSSWAPDLWGRGFLEELAAERQLEVTEAEAEGTLLLLQSETARTYLSLRAAQERLDVLEASLELAREQVKLTELLAAQELSSGFELLQAEARVSSVLADREDAQSQVVTLGYALATLVGRAPVEVDALVTASRPVPSYRDGIPAGVPSDLLARRPDLRQARASLLAAVATSDAEDLNRLPTFSLTGDGGLTSILLDNLFTADARRGLLGATLNWQAYTGGRLRAERDVADAREDQAAAAYDRAVLAALEDLETAFENYVSTGRRQAALRVLEGQRRELVELAELRFRNALDSQFQVIEAQENLLAARRSLVDAREAEAITLVDINLALGGWWGAVPDGEDELFLLAPLATALVAQTADP